MILETPHKRMKLPRILLVMSDVTSVHDDHERCNKQVEKHSEDETSLHREIGNKTSVFGNCEQISTLMSTKCCYNFALNKKNCILINVFLQFRICRLYVKVYIASNTEELVVHG